MVRDSSVQQDPWPKIVVVEPDQASAEGRQMETIEGLFASLESPLLNYAYRLLHDLESAEDIVQEAFLRLHARFSEVRQPRRWLYRTVHNLALNHHRAVVRTKLLPDLSDQGTGLEREAADPGPLPDEQIARWEAIGQVRLSLDLLDARSRQLLDLKFHEGLSYKEISHRTRLTVGHVGYLLHHALKALAAELSRAGLLP
jgi:RNA polymerase sigma factor (sigma-70 family)